MRRLEIGDIFWTNFTGDNHIQNGVRPAVIVQNSKGNIFSPTTHVVPLTSRLNKAKLPTHTIVESNEMTGLSKDSIAQCEGSRLISKVDILGKMGRVDDETMKRIAKCLLINTPLLVFFTGDELLKLHNKLLIDCKKMN